MQPDNPFCLLTAYPSLEMFFQLDLNNSSFSICHPAAEQYIQVISYAHTQVEIDTMSHYAKWFLLVLDDYSQQHCQLDKADFSQKSANTKWLQPFTRSRHATIDILLLTKVASPQFANDRIRHDELQRSEAEEDNIKVRLLLYLLHKFLYFFLIRPPSCNPDNRPFSLKNKTYRCLLLRLLLIHIICFARYNFLNISNSRNGFLDFWRYIIDRLMHRNIVFSAIWVPATVLLQNGCRIN